MKYGRRIASVAGAIKGQLQDIFATDFQPARDDSVCRITVRVFAAAASVFLVPSSGDPIGLNGGADIPANTTYTQDVPLDTGRTWNLQTAALGIACDAVVQELSLVT